MLRIIASLLFIFLVHQAFSQGNKFERFLTELNIYKANDTVIVALDSTFAKDIYELKWIHIKGTYGGSPYGGRGKAIEVKSKKDAYLPEFNAVEEDDSLEFSLYPITVGYRFPLSDAKNPTTELVGGEHFIETFKYNEPQPTSAYHYVFVRRYYVLKED